MKHFLLTLTLVFFSISAFSQRHSRSIKLDLWTHGAPVESVDSTDSAQVYIYFPDQERNTGRAVVICPGGGYTHLSMENEGHRWADFFQGLGVTAVVLKYRMPHGNPQVPICDAEGAMKMVRSNAEEWGIKEGHIGIMGFSAGAHLASVIATQSHDQAKADFQILYYPVISMMEGTAHQGSLENLLGQHSQKRLQRQYSSDFHVSRWTPRAFICLADDDEKVLPINGINYYMQLYKHGVPVSLHAYPKGGHGFGFRGSFPFHAEMIQELKAWLQSF